MTPENLEKAKKLEKEIDNCKRYIRFCNYTQLKDVEPRTMDVRFNGVEGGIQVPDTLFRIIGKLILVEYTAQLNQLQDEFNSL